MRIKRVRLKFRYNLILKLQHVATILSMFIYPIILSRFDDLHQLSKLLFRCFLFRFFRSSRKLRLATARRWRCLTSLLWFAGILEAPDLLSYSLARQVCWNMWPMLNPCWRGASFQITMRDADGLQGYLGGLGTGVVTSILVSRFTVSGKFLW